MSDRSELVGKIVLDTKIEADDRARIGQIEPSFQIRATPHQYLACIGRVRGL